MNRIFYKLIRLSLAIFLLTVSLAIPFGSVSATIGGATLTVNSNSDADNGSDGVCTLREALTAALNDADYHECINSGSPYANDMIVFSVSGSRTITLTSNLPWISTGTLTIDGFNSGLPITIDGANTYQPFNNSATLTLRSLTIQHGSASSGGAIGSGGTLTVINSTFLNNIATSDGGAIVLMGGGATIVNSTFSTNSASYGGGIAENGGTISIYNSTLSGNTATSNGGAFSSWNTPVTAIYNTIMANSTAPEDCWQGLGGTLTGDHNIIETTGGGIQSCSSVTISTSDPTLGTAAGSPAYFPLNSGSPAIDTGNNAICAAAPVSNTSQNGVTRSLGSHCDIGSFELIYKLFLPLLLR
jgi:CSLREA domain-containing protein